MGLSLLSLPTNVRLAVNRARSEARIRGFEAVITSTFRTRSEQQFLFDQFQRGLTSFPVAPPGSSRHEFGLAVDMLAVPPSNLPELVSIMRSVGFQWAGPSDSVHFDYVLPLERSRVPVERTTRPSVLSFRLPQVLPTRVTGGVRPPSDFSCPL